ncbi:hypothetical protein J6590_042547 [Homalodisca vitripennis]|nr:hypothetical protein J6590_042547 [Homalodisca vitripennis]
MATAKQKAFCVIEYGRSETTIVVYCVQPIDRWCIKCWYKQFIENGCLFKGKNSGRLRTSDENVARIQQAFVRNTGTSTRRASRELQLPQTTVRRVLRKSLKKKHNNSYFSIMERQHIGTYLSVNTHGVNYPRRWIGRQAARDRAFHHWPPRSPDLTSCEFFL